MAIIEEKEVQVIKKQVFWTNSRGDQVPLESVQDHELDQDKFVTDLMKDAQELRDYIEAKKAEFSQRIDDYLNQTSAKYGRTWSGNAIISDFAIRNRITKRIGKFLTFDHHLQLAEQIIKELIKEWSANSDVNLAAVAMDAFNVDGTGRYDRDKILGLKKIKVSPEYEERWAQAMKLIDDATRIQATKEYFYFQTRTGKDEWKTLVLDFSKIGDYTTAASSEGKADEQ